MTKQKNAGRLITSLSDRFIQEHEDLPLKEIGEKFKVVLRRGKDFYSLADEIHTALMGYITADRDFRSLPVLKLFEKDDTLYAALEELGLDIAFIDKDPTPVYLVLKIDSDDNMSFINLAEPAEGCERSLGSNLEVGDILAELECGRYYCPTDELPF